VARKVDVVICGKVITLVSNEEEAHLRRIASYIDLKMAELTEANTTAAIDERIRTLLLALNISDEYFKVADRLARVDAEQEKYINEINRMQQEDMQLKEKYHALQAEHAKLQAEYAHLHAEHEEFIETFENEKQAEKVLPLNQRRLR